MDRWCDHLNNRNVAFTIPIKLKRLPVEPAGAGPNAQLFYEFNLSGDLASQQAAEDFAIAHS
jgi:hypothetical protein